MPEAPANVCFGSKAPVRRCPRYVRSCSESSGIADTAALRVRADCGSRSSLDHLVGGRVVGASSAMFCAGAPFAEAGRRPHLPFMSPAGSAALSTYLPAPRLSASRGPSGAAFTLPRAKCACAAREFRSLSLPSQLTGESLISAAPSASSNADLPLHYFSVCRRDRPDRHNLSEFQAVLLLAWRLVRPAAAAARRPPLRCTRQGTQRTGSTPRHWPVQCLRPRIQ